MILAYMISVKTFSSYDDLTYPPCYKSQWGITYTVFSNPTEIYEYILHENGQDIGWAVVTETLPHYCDDYNHTPIYSVSKFLATFAIKDGYRNQGWGRILIDRIKKDHKLLLLNNFKGNLWFYKMGANYLQGDIYEGGQFMVFGSDEETSKVFYEFGGKDYDKWVKPINALPHNLCKNKTCVENICCCDEGDEDDADGVMKQIMNK